jgi:hypothetical protein
MNNKEKKNTNTKTVNFQKKKKKMSENNNNNELIMIAKHDFVAQSATELSFAKGDQLIVLKKDSSGWVQAELASSGARGWVPFDFLTMVTEDVPKRQPPKPPPETPPKSGQAVKEKKRRKTFDMKKTHKKKKACWKTKKCDCTSIYLSQSK